MSKADDRSKTHLDWLLTSRARNMDTTKTLYLLISQHSTIISGDVYLQNIAHDLSSIAFSLWRSVFLSDATGDIVDQTADLTEFLGNLLSNNTIAYPQDKNAKEFSFRYYLTNAQQRLSSMAVHMPSLVQPDWAAAPVGIKNDWIAAQQALEKAVGDFEITLQILS